MSKSHERYIGTKFVKATPMLKAEYLNIRGMSATDNEEIEEGYLVEYTDGGKPNTDLYDGYVSWSPKGVFERAYRTVDAMSFGNAIEALKLGLKVARKGWNGKGIFIEAQKPDAYSKMSHPYFFIDTTGLESANEYASRNRVPWAPSQTDMWAEDWVIVNNSDI